jgi:Flp pilus assembly protein TadD
MCCGGDIGFNYVIAGVQPLETGDEAIRLNPQHAQAYAHRGSAYEDLGNSIQAEKDFAKAKELGYRR